jgi:hypothetical protein
MSNLSYCRLQNTRKDLEDCESALDDLLCQEAKYEISNDELEAAKLLVSTCLRIVRSFSECTGTDIEDIGEIDFEQELNKAARETKECLIIETNEKKRK